jgi:hypothetical protein
MSFFRLRVVTVLVPEISLIFVTWTTLIPTALLARTVHDQRDALGLPAALAGRKRRPVLCSFLTDSLIPALFLYFV